jgi:S-formylglutathione hydrolase
MAIETLSEHRCFGGVQGFYRHESRECGVPMRFGVYRPPQAEKGPVPVLYFLAGLTCTEETFAIKSGAQLMAATLGLMLVTPDTSPRDTGTPHEGDDWEVGVGAGFYLDATQPPWSRHYRMHSYVVEELPELIALKFPGDVERTGILGHSMGGHGALTIGLAYPRRYRSVSALAPIVAPMQVPWGVKAFSRFLGPDRKQWKAYDACELVRQQTHPTPILVDQGLSDRFLDVQLRPGLFEAACADAGQELRLRHHVGYDHSYYFVASLIGDHLRHHAKLLGL